MYPPPISRPKNDKSIHPLAYQPIEKSQLLNYLKGIVSLTRKIHPYCAQVHNQKPPKVREFAYLSKYHYQISFEYLWKSIAK